MSYRAITLPTTNIEWKKKWFVMDMSNEEIICSCLSEQWAQRIAIILNSSHLTSSETRSSLLPKPEGWI